VLPDPLLEIAPYEYAAAQRLAAALGITHVTAQVLVRRGYGDPARAQAFLDAADAHPLEAFGGLREAAAHILSHVGRRSHITVHGDYDCDGVCSTAILVRALHTLGAQVDWWLPNRLEDGYGLSAHTVERLAARGTDLLITADCAITAVEEVAAARAAGLDVVVTDHHTPRADGALPDAPIVHPALGDYPCPDLCATGVAYKLAAALLEGSGMDPALADEDLDLVALATVADVVPLRGENRRLVREGLRALASTRKPGLRALMAVSRVVATELDRVNAERRDVETRIRFEAEALVAQTPGAPAYVLAGEGWHPGVVGIVAARIAERFHRPAVLVALDGEEGSGSGRSIPGFDLLAGLQAGSEHLKRFGGHRAAAGLTIGRADVDAFRDTFVAHAASVLTPEDLVPRERIDAIAPGHLLGLPLAEELERLAPFGMGNPAISLLVPAATLEDPKPMGEGRHVTFTLNAGGARSRAVAFGRGATLPATPGTPVDAAVRLELNRWNGTVEPRLVLRSAQPPLCAPIEILDAPFAEAVVTEVVRDLADGVPGDAGANSYGSSPLSDDEPQMFDSDRELCDVRGGGIAGVLADLVATREPVLVLAAHAEHRHRALRDRVGGFALATWCTFEDDPGLAAEFTHVVALDPPPVPHLQAALQHAPGEGWAHLAWGKQELDLALRVLEFEHALRAPLIMVYRALRAAGRSAGSPCEALLRGEAARPNTATLAGRLLRLLCELELATLSHPLELEVCASPQRKALESAPAYRCYAHRLDEGRQWLTKAAPATVKAA